MWLDDGPGAVFAGDLLHTPLQNLRPDDVCVFDLDPGQATAARRHVLAGAARTGAVVIPAHLAGRGAATRGVSGKGYASTWSELGAV